MDGTTAQQVGRPDPAHALDEKTECDAWYFGDARYMVGAAAPAMAVWPEHPPYRPQRLDDVDPATWRAPDRLKRMDEYGIWAQVRYPNIVFFGTERC